MQQSQVTSGRTQPARAARQMQQIMQQAGLSLLRRMLHLGLRQNQVNLVLRLGQIMQQAGLIFLRRMLRL